MDITLAAMVAHLAGANSEADQVRAWNNALSIHRGGIISSRIDEFGSSVPPGIAPILNEILAALTDFDYSRRPRKLENIRQKIWAAIKIIENQKIYDARLARLRDERRKREEKLRTREQAIQSNVLRQAC
ncbi:hypothetical protein [Burkholderia gladioli]|nr:hypothetical protein [Burkholderia gladioli]